MMLIRSRTAVALALILGTAVACRDDDDKAGAAAGLLGGGGSGPASASELILAARREGAFLPPELADARYADEGTLPMKPFQLPALDASRAGMEQEPNDAENQATPMGAGFAARGQIVQGDYDFFSFESTGEPQLWAIEAVGRGVGNLLLHAAGSYRIPGQEVDSGRFVISNVFISPGRHTVEVRGHQTGSAYTVRAVPLGRPDLRMEREPNDDDAFAHPLRFGISRVGLAMHSGDHDMYRFSLRQNEHVLLQVTPPSDLVVRVTVESKALESTITFTSPKPGQAMRLDARLPTGDYIVRIRADDKGSVTPYKVRLDRLDPFVASSDQEPNNRFEDAIPVPDDLVLKGTGGEYGDADWYRLPLMPRETSLRFQALALPPDATPSRIVTVMHAPTASRTEYVEWARNDSIYEMKLPANTPHQ